MIDAWNPKHPVLNGCLVKQPFSITRFGIIQLKQPFINGCLGFQVYIYIYIIYMDPMDPLMLNEKQKSTTLCAPHSHGIL